MDLGDVTQLALVTTMVLVFGRLGWAFARLIDRRSSADPRVQSDLAERLQMLEGEHLALRQEVAELQERQDFAERTLLRDRAQPKLPAPPAQDRLVTPH